MTGVQTCALPISRQGSNGKEGRPGSPGNGSSTPPATTTPEPKPSEPPAGKPKAKEPLFVRKSALDQPEPEKSGEPATDRYNSYNRPRPKPAPSPSPAAQGGPSAPGSAAAGQGPPGTGDQAPPAGVHNLPVSSLFSLCTLSC